MIFSYRRCEYAHQLRAPQTNILATCGRAGIYDRRCTRPLVDEGARAQAMCSNLPSPYSDALSDALTCLLACLRVFYCL
jgi:hypothetical protein